TTQIAPRSTNSPGLNLQELKAVPPEGRPLYFKPSVTGPAAGGLPLPHRRQYPKRCKRRILDLAPPLIHLANSVQISPEPESGLRPDRGCRGPECVSYGDSQSFGIQPLARPFGRAPPRSG